MKTAAIMKIVRLEMINYPPHAFKKGAGRLVRELETSPAGREDLRAVAGREL